MGPIRDTLRDFLVYPDAATRRLMLELEPILQARAAMEEGSENDGAKEEGDDYE